MSRATILENSPSPKPKGGGDFVVDSYRQIWEPSWLFRFFEIECCNVHITNPREDPPAVWPIVGNCYVITIREVEPRARRAVGAASRWPPCLRRHSSCFKIFATQYRPTTSKASTLRLTPNFSSPYPCIMAAVAVESYRADLQPPLSRPLTKLPRRKPIIRQPAATPLPPSTYEALKGLESKPTPDRCRSMVVPGLYVAYRAEEENKLVVVEDGKRYTRAITISQSDERTSRLTTHSLPDGSSIDALHLTVPHPDEAGRVGLGLTPEQLKSSVEFLSTTPPTDGGARMLITCPARHQTDVMCVVAAHLSSIIEEDVEDILKVIDMVEELHSAWKGEVNGEEVDIIREVVSKASCTLP